MYQIILAKEIKIKNFQSWILQTRTKLNETGNNFSFFAYGNSLYAIKKDGENNSTEVHCLNI